MTAPDRQEENRQSIVRNVGYIDVRGGWMWDTVIGIANDLEQADAGSPRDESAASAW